MKLRTLLVALILAGCLAGLLAGYRALSPAPACAPQPGDPIHLEFAPKIDHPFIVTREGKLFHPSGDSWMQMVTDAPVNTVYIEYDGTIYAGTTAGLLVYKNTGWQTVPDVPPTDAIASMHGFLFAMGKQGVARTEEGIMGDGTWRRLKMPLPEAPSEGMVMLGDHSHLILNGSLAQTNDMGLSWSIVPPPGEVRLMANDALDNLLVVIDDGLYRWQFTDKTWSKLAGLPDDLPVNTLVLFNADTYALADGQLFRLENSNWMTVPVPGTANPCFTTMNVQNQNRLWLADAANQALWSTDNAKDWQKAAMSF